MQINKFAPVSSSEVIHGLFCSRKFHSQRWPIAAELMFAVSVSSELNVNSVKISGIGRRKPAHFMHFQRVLTR